MTLYRGRTAAQRPTISPGNAMSVGCGGKLAAKASELKPAGIVFRITISATKVPSVGFFAALCAVVLVHLAAFSALVPVLLV